MRATFLMALWVPVSLVILLLPGVAIVAAAGPRRLVRSSVDPLACGVVAALLVHFLSFFLWYLQPVVGRTATWVALGAAVVVCARKSARATVVGWWRDGDVRFSSAVVVGVALVVLGSLLLHGGAARPTDTAAQRWTDTRLPPDNVLPAMLADRVVTGAPTEPFFAGWQSSDRPPLQAGAVAFTEPLRMGLSFEQHYQVVSTSLAALCLAGLFSLLRRLRVERTVAMAAVLSAAASGTVVLNAAFVWPKLLSAALALYAASLLIPTPERRNGPVDWASGGTAAALSLLAHGAGMYAMLPAVLVAPVVVAVLRPAGRWWRAAVWGPVAAAAVMLPWLAYQRVVAPPGDRLLTWHLAGVQEVVDRPWYSVVVSQYRSIGWSGAWHNHWENVSVLANHDHVLWRLVRDAVTLRGPTQTLRSIEFGHALNGVALGWPALGVAFGALVLRRGRRDHALDVGAVLVGYGAWALIVWCAMAYGPAATTPHQGTAVTALLLLAGPVVAVAHVHRSAAWVLTALSVLRVAWVWVLAADPLRPQLSASAVAVLGAGVAVICAAVLLGAATGEGQRS